MRILAGVTALFATVAVASAILLCFHSASPQVWLAPTPELMEMAAACERFAAREVRQLCKQQVVAVRLARERQGVQTASRQCARVRP